MNEVITNLINEWGFDMPENVLLPMVYIISTLCFCLVFWFITKIISPGASAMRTFVMKYVCVAMAVVVCLSCVATHGIKIGIQNEVSEDSITRTEYAFSDMFSSYRVPFDTEVIQLLNEEFTYDSIIMLGALERGLNNAFDATVNVYKNGKLLITQPMVENDNDAGVLLISVSAGDNVVINITSETYLMGEPYSTIDLAVSCIPNIAIINA